MKTCFFAIASLALSLPASAQQEQVANAILSASQTLAASQNTYGLSVMGKASATLRADSCYLYLYIGANRGMGGGRGGSFGGGGRMGMPTSEELAQSESKARQQKRQALIDALQPLGLILDKQTGYRFDNGPFGGMVQMGGNDYVSITLPINEKGIVVFGTSTLAKVRQTLKILEIESSFIFHFSTALQQKAQKTLPTLAVKNGIEQAKSLAALAGASQIKLIGMEEFPGIFLQDIVLTWPEGETLTAPQNNLTHTVKLLFGPLNIVISTKK